MSVKLLVDGIQSKKTVTTIRISLDTGLTKVKSQINTKIVHNAMTCVSPMQPSHDDDNDGQPSMIKDDGACL